MSQQEMEALANSIWNRYLVIFYEKKQGKRLHRYSESSHNDYPGRKDLIINKLVKQEGVKILDWVSDTIETFSKEKALDRVQKVIKELEEAIEGRKSPLYNIWHIPVEEELVELEFNYKVFLSELERLEEPIKTYSISSGAGQHIEKEKSSNEKVEKREVEAGVYMLIEYFENNENSNLIPQGYTQMKYFSMLVDKYNLTEQKSIATLKKAYQNYISGSESFVKGLERLSITPAQKTHFKNRLIETKKYFTNQGKLDLALKVDRYLESTIFN